jgi:hypothetical protein
VNALLIEALLIGIETAEGIECHSQIGSGDIISEEVNCAALATRDLSCFSQDFKSKAGLMMLQSRDEAVIGATHYNQPKYLAIGCGAVRFSGPPRSMEDIAGRRKCLPRECRVCGGVLRDWLCSEMIAHQFAKVHWITGWSGDCQHRPDRGIDCRRFSSIAESELNRERHCGVLIGTVNGAERINDRGVNSDPWPFINLHDTKLAAHDIAQPLHCGDRSVRFTKRGQSVGMLPISNDTSFLKSRAVSRCA